METFKQHHSSSKVNFMLLCVIYFCALWGLFTKSLSAQQKLPSVIDHSQSKYFPKVFDQGNIGSCDWFAAVYYQMTFMYNQYYDRAAGQENTFSPKFGYNFLNNGGIFPYNIRVDDVYKFVQKHGSATMADYPYDLQYIPWCTDAEIWRKAVPYRIEGYRYFTLNNRSWKADYSFDNFSDYFNEIKRLLAEGEVLVIQSETPSDDCLYTMIDNDPDTPVDDKFEGQKIIYSGVNGPEHTVAIVGYNDHIWIDINEDGKVQDGEKGALKIADSYRIKDSNHNEGFLWMAYSTVNNSIFEYRVNRMQIRHNYQPGLLCKITLNTAERGKIKFQFGRSTSANQQADPPGDSQIFDPYGLGYEKGTAGVSLIEGANIPFDGGGEAIDGSFIFDLTDIYKEGSEDFYYLRISNAGRKPLIIKEFEIININTGKTIKDTGLPESVREDEVYRFLKF